MLVIGSDNNLSVLPGKNPASDAGNGIVVLGFPSGNHDFIKNIQSRKSDEEKHCLELRNVLHESLQASYELLSYWICSMYKHLDRTVSLTLLEHIAKKHDRLLRELVRLCI